jgi:hypothetical protein
MQRVGSTIQNARKATMYGSAWISISLAAPSPTFTTEIRKNQSQSHRSNYYQTQSKSTCNILSNKRLHINSQRFRSDATMDELMPVALVD